MSGAAAVLALSRAIELMTLAAEAAPAAQRISALIQQRQAAGSEITNDDWIELLADRATAQALLAASIVRRQGN